MLDVFNTTLLEELGYKFKKTQDFSDPLDPRYRPRPSAASDYEESSIRSTLSALGNLGAYKHAAQVAAAESKFYATAGYPTESGSPGTATGSPAPASGNPTGSAAPVSGAPTGNAAPVSGSPSDSAVAAPATSTPAQESGTLTGYPHRSHTGSQHSRPSESAPANTKRWEA